MKAHQVFGVIQCRKEGNAELSATMHCIFAYMHYGRGCFCKVHGAWLASALQLTVAVIALWPVITFRALVASLYRSICSWWLLQGNFLFMIFKTNEWLNYPLAGHQVVSSTVAGTCDMLVNFFFTCRVVCRPNDEPLALHPRSVDYPGQYRCSKD